MKVLVTGATGFLGSCVTQALLASGHSVRALVRRPDRPGALARRDVEIAPGDVVAPDTVAAAVSGVDAIVHCAGLTSWRIRDRAPLFRVNVDGTRNVLRAAAAQGIRVLHTSSIASIGPTREPRELDEESPATALDFDCPYTESKRASEQLAQTFAARGADVVVLSPGVLLGPGDVHYTSTAFVRHYLRGELRHYLEGGSSFCDVRDVARAYVAALHSGRRGERYLLAGANRTHAAIREDLRRLTGLHRCARLPAPVAEWAAYWSEATAFFVPHPFEDLNVALIRWGSRFAYCSSAKAERELGFRPRSLSQSLADTVADHLVRCRSEQFYRYPQSAVAMQRQCLERSRIGQRIRQGIQPVVVQKELLELGELAHRLRQSFKLVACDIEMLQPRQLAQRLGKRRNAVLKKVQRLKIVQLSDGLRELE